MRFQIRTAKQKHFLHAGEFRNEFAGKAAEYFFRPKKAKNLPVLIFYYGGSWKSGKKELYSFLGNRLARRGVVAVMVDYPLNPEFQVPSMEAAATNAVIWTAENIREYGGNPDQLFVSGHSAGGHLASLVAVKDSNFEQLGKENPLKGAVLIDPAGLDMYSYLMETSEGEGKKYTNAFTTDPEIWKQSSPIFFLEAGQIPMLILEGEETYPSIRAGRGRFTKVAEEKGLDVEVKIYPKKKHIPMITQFLWTWSRGYEDVLEFLEKR
ncbi:alpha/beta hydrolase [Algoriphagus boritolerans]|uniref:alpha/beta hydrolase n=1 Tax=Algoriphagus boritolerans TaxID=308111 RepID=UPI002FCE00C8